MTLKRFFKPGHNLSDSEVATCQKTVVWEVCVAVCVYRLTPGIFLKHASQTTAVLLEELLSVSSLVDVWCLDVSNETAIRFPASVMESEKPLTGN